MLTIFKAANPEYYAEYLDKDKQGVWIAYLKEVLNLPDIVTEEHYWNLIKGYSPDGRTRLFQGNGKEHLGAQDFTFSACKSVSLSMIENKEEIIQAHEEAVNAAIRFLEEHAAYTRRGKDGIKLEKVHGLLVSKHTHYESRAEQPQLHTHCLIYNLCEREDGTWGSLSYRHFYKWKMAAGAIYRCQLALNLRELGYELRQEGDFFEIEGISEDLLKKYSKREQEISERISQLRLKNSSNKVGDKAVLHTRQSKTAATTAELFERWEKELEGLVTPKRSLENSPISGQLYVLPTEVLRELTTKKSYFREQDVYHRLAIKGQASFLSASDVSKIAAMTLGSSRVIQLGVDKNNNQCFTTTEALLAEKAMIQQATDLAKSRFFIPAKFESTFEQGISHAESDLGFALEDEQIEAVKLATNAHKLTLIQGTAGTGKSTSFRAAKYIYEARGQSMLGASVSKKAADSLAESAEISTFTVDMLVAQYNSGYNQLKNHAALIVDEASLLTVFQLNMLFKMALESNTKLVLAGDTFQLQAIEQPGAFNYLLKNGVAAATKLENIRRQEADWSRKIVNQFKIGQAKPALKALYDNGFVQFNEGYDQAVSELVKLYFKLEEEQADKSRLVLAKSWRDVKAISQLIRAELQRRGVVQQNAVELDCSVSDKVFKQEFAIGDRVRLSKNDYSLKLSNGMQGTIVGMNRSGEDWAFKILLDDKRQISISTSTYQSQEGHFPLVQAYASTIYSAQGVTVNGDSLVLANSYFDRANTYVASSRHKQNCYWFFNSEEVDIALLDDHKQVNDDNRLQQVAQWCEQESEVKLASEFLQSEQVQTKIKHLSL